jgi:AcrR family transcriptional regulator
VIQYYFGSREQLLLAVVHDSTDRLVASLSSATIAGETAIERIGSLADVVWDNYGRPEFLVRMQIVLNLSRDPRTADQTREALATVEKRIGGVWERLMGEAVPSRDRKFAAAVFDILRGVAIGDSVSEDFARQRRRRYPSNEREVVVQALALLVEQ